MTVLQRCQDCANIGNVSTTIPKITIERNIWYRSKTVAIAEIGDNLIPFRNSSKHFERAVLTIVGTSYFFESEDRHENE